ncbi:MAG: T9SS type A sorting domain-containing protein, partial [Bacteroidales bacterium]|nr:T9SS type A sorting domain-containing protein [Bacteroidales bacterium]
DEPENFGAWPGVTSKKDADGWYTVNLPASEFEIGHVIFNNGAAREEAEQFDADNVTHKTACYEISLTAATEIDCEGAAIEELSKANSVKIYPNPATSNITIDLENIKNINVLNMGGKTVMNAGNSNVINVGKLPAGVYFIKIMQNTGVIKYSKFIKK